ncbi:MAG: HAMP domain-containing sensor histidine kinase [Deferribacterota bacterium]|nr:HAMP domain-containing sensor histidine kinase [Deferribacterota bacterium]
MSEYVLSNLPYVVINSNKEIIDYSYNFESIWNELVRLNIKDIQEYIFEKLYNNKPIINFGSKIYFILADKSKELTIIYFIDITAITQYLEDYFDINSFFHELKNPLTVIDGVVQLLQREKLDSYLNKCISVINSETNRIKSLLDDFKSISKQQIFKNPFDVKEFIDELITSFNIAFPDINIKLEFDPNLDIINGDRNKLYSAFYNILKNACEAQKEGIVKLTAFIDPVVKYYDKHLDKGLLMARFNIIDYAGGINTEIREKIFNPFFTTKSKGHGLGLTIAKKIIESHNGKIDIKCINGLETTFSILLPL